MIIFLQSLLELNVNITDVDSFGADDPVDTITIPLSAQLRAGSEFSPSKTYFGMCGRANMAVKFRITSQCLSNFYGPHCTKQCIEQPGQSACNYLGDTITICTTRISNQDCICEGNFVEPYCIACEDNYYPAGQCTTECIPQNSFHGGHYTCDPATGDKICSEGYVDPSTSCITEEDSEHAEGI